MERLTIEKTLNNKLFSYLTSTPWAVELNSRLDTLFFDKYYDREAGSSIIRKLRDGEEVLEEAKAKDIIDNIYGIYAYKWQHLYRVVSRLSNTETDYDPLNNYDRTEKTTRTTEHTGTDTTTRTPELTTTDTASGTDSDRIHIIEKSQTHTESGTDTTTRTPDLMTVSANDGTDTTTRTPELSTTTEAIESETTTQNNINAFNSTGGVNTDGSSQQNKNKEKTDNTGTETTATEHGLTTTETVEGTDTQATVYGKQVVDSFKDDTTNTTTYGKVNTNTETGTETTELERDTTDTETTESRIYGNIGTMTSAQALQSELDVFNSPEGFDYFVNIVFKDTIKLIALEVY